MLEIKHYFTLRKSPNDANKTGLSVIFTLQKWCWQLSKNGVGNCLFSEVGVCLVGVCPTFAIWKLFIGFLLACVLNFTRN